jgi:ABC-type multidrug transport system fused ATPase/permease subunit
LFVTPWFGIAIIPLAVIYFYFLNYFREVSRETKRLESISRSPVYAHFSETLGGLVTIRAYGEGNRFMGDFEGKVDENTKAYYNNKSADRWLSLRLEMIGSTVAGLAAIFSVQVAISGAASGLESNSQFASLAGLSLTLAISLTSLLNWCVRSFAQLEAAMNACERVLYYTDNIQREAPWTCEELEAKVAISDTIPSPSDPSSFAVRANNGKAAAITPEWPNVGEIVLSNLKMRYRSDTPLVLKGLNVTIAGGERIGVVGRTGKSSLLACLGAGPWGRTPVCLTYLLITGRFYVERFREELIASYSFAVGGAIT